MTRSGDEQAPRGDGYDLQWDSGEGHPPEIRELIRAQRTDPVGMFHPSAVPAMLGHDTEVWYRVLGMVLLALLVAGPLLLLFGTMTRLGLGTAALLSVVLVGGVVLYVHLRRLLGRDGSDDAADPAARRRPRRRSSREA